MWSRADEVHYAPELPGTGSHLASWIPNARTGLEASEPPRTRIQGKFLVPPTATEPPSLGVEPRALHVYLHSVSPSTLCCQSLHSPSTLPVGLGLAPTKSSLLLNPETSLILSHRISQRLSLRKHSSPRPLGPGLALLGSARHSGLRNVDSASLMSGRARARAGSLKDSRAIL